MATITNGILGPFSGIVGTVSGYSRNGKNFMRSRRRKTSSRMTPRRLAQQQKIKVCNEFTRPFSGRKFFTKTFPAYGHSGTGFNRATSAIMNLAIVGTYPDTAVDYAKVLISKGPLPAAVNASAVADTDKNILFRWEDNTGTGTAKPNDKVILVAYFTDVKKAVFTIGAAMRKDGEALLETTLDRGKIAETWMGFLSNDEEDAGDSVYCGRADL